jgi:hypothetical protein
MVPLLSTRQPARNWAEKAADGVVHTVAAPAVWYPLNTALYAVGQSKNGKYQAGSASTGLVKALAYRQSAIQLAKAENRFLKNHPKALEWVNNHPWLGGALLTAGVVLPSFLISDGAALLAGPLAKKAETAAWKHLKGTAVGNVLQQVWKGVFKVLGNVYVLSGILVVLLGSMIIRGLRNIRESRDFKQSYQQARKTYDIKQVDPLTLRYAVMMAKLQPQNA